MSKRKIILLKFKNGTKGMAPYVTDRAGGKWIIGRPTEIPYCYATKALKLELKNANRSLKKSIRQSAKREIQSEL